MKENLNTLVLATHNRDKVQELKSILKDFPVEILTLDDFPEIGEIEETGTTLLENALLKARTVHRETGLPAIADDTGLEVDALDGRPGVYAARYAGENVSYDDNVEKLLREMLNVPREKRTARFRTVVAYVDNNQELWAEGFIKGMILEKKQGTGGFGYDPVFWVPERKKTFAELSLNEKNEISHRGVALRKLRDVIVENRVDIFLT